MGIFVENWTRCGGYPHAHAPGIMPLGGTPLPRAAAPKRPGAAFARVLEIVAGVHPQMCDMAKRHAMNQIHAVTTVRILRLSLFRVTQWRCALGRWRTRCASCMSSGAAA